MWELDCEESWPPKNWCFWTVALEKTLGNPLDCKETQPVHPKGNQSWIFLGRTEAKAETPLLWPMMWRTDSLEKALMLGKIEGRSRSETEDEMVGWHHWLNGRESEQTPGDNSEGQGSLVCCSPWGHKESDMTDWAELNWTSKLLFYQSY